MVSRAVAQEQIDTTLRGAVEAREVPGIVAMATTKDGPIYQGAFGVRDLGSGTAMTPDTVFRIASMTKAITSVAAMQLVEEGKLSLDGPLPDIDPTLSKPQVLEGFDAGGAPILRPAKRPITLKHLLTHTAGFNYEVWNSNTKRYVESGAMPSDRVRPARRCCASRSPSTPAINGNTASTSTGLAALSNTSPARRSTSICANTSLRRSAWRTLALLPHPSRARGRPAFTSAKPMAVWCRSRCKRRRNPSFLPAVAGSIRRVATT